jgi:hypothetical protein
LTTRKDIKCAKEKERLKTDNNSKEGLNSGSAKDMWPMRIAMMGNKQMFEPIGHNY